MSNIENDDTPKLDELLRRTGEFIAYFEIAESKMVQWREEIEQLAEAQKNQFIQQSQAINKEIETLHTLLTNLNTSQLQQAHLHLFQQSEQSLKQLEKSKIDLKENLLSHQALLDYSVQKMIDDLGQKGDEVLTRLSSQVAKYDANQFNRIANESCDHVKRIAQDTLYKSGKVLHLFQWKLLSFTILTTFITAFIIVFYLNDEAPWEMHQQVLSEREAGKLLLKSWPHLSHQEKQNILHHEANQHA